MLYISANILRLITIFATSSCLTTTSNSDIGRINGQCGWEEGKRKKKKKEYNNGGPKKCWSIERPVLSLWQGGGGEKQKKGVFSLMDFFFF